ncbi:MAG: matrixin family metalloprotease, partial [Actinomycetota bacterium]
DVLDAGVDGGSSKRKVRRTCPMARDAVRVCNFRYGATGWAGLSQFQLQGKHIRRASIKLNETYLGSKHRKTTCHELGHGLGLAHRSDPSSCMMQGSGVRAHPDAHDYRMLEKIYGHTHAADRTSSSDDGEWRIVTIKHPA